MANLTQSQALELIKAPRNQKEILRARAKKNRHRLHTEAETETDYLYGESHAKFLKWVESLLKSDENFARFKSLYRPPVPTNELTESIFSEFERVFEAEDAYDKFEFDTPETEADAAQYRNRLGDSHFWETQGFETFKSSIDNIVVVDLPKLKRNAAGQIEILSEFPEPYYYILDINSLIDIDNTKVKAVDSGGDRFIYFKTEYLIFCEDRRIDTDKKEIEIICVFDDTFYRTYSRKAGADPVLIDEVAHDLGYCPARSFWTTPLNSRSTILKRSVITNSLSELDWLLFYEIAAKYLKLYAPFPIYAVYKGLCNYKDPTAKVKCVDGYLVGENAPKGEHSSIRCPKCANKIKTGPGNILELRAPQDKEDPDLLANPMKVIPAEEKSLEAVNEELRTKKDSIFKNCVGDGGDPENKQAQNELQVQSGFERRTNVLMKVKRNFEIIHLFALDTCYRLRYRERYKGGMINYGTQFFLKDESAEIQEYKVAKEQGLPTYDLAIRRGSINEARYRNNPDLMQRIKILENLDPLPDLDIKGALELVKLNPGVISAEDMLLKAHFNRLISRFEREQTNVLTFGSAISFDKKIAKILEVLKSYTKELTPTQADPEPESDPDVET